MTTERNVLIAALEGFVSQIENLADELALHRGNRRAISVAITKLDEARLWIGEAIVTEH